MGKKTTTITWTPKSHIEIQAELDARWTSPMIKKEAESDWPALAMRLLPRMLQSTLNQDQLYAWRNPGTNPLAPLWTCRIRLTAEQSEKIICASGLEACFTRPTDHTSLPSSQAYTIVWASRHHDAQPGLLTELLQHASAIPGHRGAARSLTAIGLRVPWDKVRDARAKLCPHDVRYQEGTLDLKDARLWRAEGCPPGASTGDLATFLKEVAWKALPKASLP